ncbi:MAG: Na/Pi cotransporter family protein [Gallionellaceae bacterium]|nr:Na/Pi cotransporter family protein [Gallionellaceae bacterium]
MLGLLIGGLALFLFGLELLTDALKAIAGARLQSLLSSLTSNKFRAVLTGAGVTALLNSSTVTTVLLVGFVSAGLMTLAQAIPMIMGANIGSTVTAQLVAFNLSAAVPYMLGAGFALHAFGKRELLRQIGGILLGSGLLFLGIEFMGKATHPLRDYEPFISAMREMQNPLFGILIGAFFTAIVQSSAATIAIVIALASQGLMPLEAGIAIVLGANAGTCGTALLAAIGKPPEALQVGLAHLLFNLFGVIVIAFLIPWYADFIRWISPSSPELNGLARLAADTPRQVANAHTIFSVAGTLALIGFTGAIERVVQRLAPSAPKIRKPSGEPRYLDKSLLAMPALAIARIQLELTALGEQVLNLVRHSARVAVSGDERDIAELMNEDRDADQLGAATLVYIGELADTDHSDSEGREIVDLSRITACLDAMREVASTSLVSVSHRRLAEGVDMARLRTPEGADFYTAVIEHLQQAVTLIGAPDDEAASRIVDAKAGIEARAASARAAIMAQLSLRTPADVLSFRLSNDMIERFNEVARLSRAVAKATRHLQAARG